MTKTDDIQNDLDLTNTPTPEQQAQAIIEQFQDWATDPKLAVLDTETTGLCGEVIELAIVDVDGNVLFNERLRPTCPIEPGAQAVHGITEADLEGKPSIAAHWPRLRKILRDYNIVVYNKGFDFPRLCETLDRQMPGWFEHPDGQPGGSHDLQLFNAAWKRAQCVMLAYTQIYGDWNDWHQSYSWAKLTAACRERGVDTSDLRPHEALSDALATLRLIQATAHLDPATLTWIGREGEL